MPLKLGGKILRHSSRMQNDIGAYCQIDIISHTSKNIGLCFPSPLPPPPIRASPPGLPPRFTAPAGGQGEDG